MYILRLINPESCFFFSQLNLKVVILPNPVILRRVKGQGSFEMGSQVQTPTRKTLFQETVQTCPVEF